MIAANASVALELPLSIFDVPELVELIVQYLSSQDIVHCMATSKAFAYQFEPLLWRNVVLKGSRPAPQSLTCNRHRIRSLSVYRNDYLNLCTISQGLPDPIPLIGSGSAPGPQSCRLINNLPVTNVNTFYRLRTLYIENSWPALGCGWEQTVVDVDSSLRILLQAPNLTHVTIPGRCLDHRHATVHARKLLYAIAHRLPRVQHLGIEADNVEPEIGLELLRICFNHPQLVELHCEFEIGAKYSASHFYSAQLCYDPRFDSFLLALENDNKERTATGKPPAGSRIKTLVLPRVYNGYPVTFLCTLLRSHLPNLEGFHVPRIDGPRQISYVDSVKDAIAQGCPKLQRIRCSWYDLFAVFYGDKNTRDAIHGVIEGCKEWGLKSFHTRRLVDPRDNESQSVMATLLTYQSKTLEDVELVDCEEVRHRDLVNLFHKCKNLKRVNIEANELGAVAISFNDVISAEWACRDLRELQLVLSRPCFDLDGGYSEPANASESGRKDDNSDNQYDDDDDYYDRYDAWMRGMAKKVYGQIGRLVKLETLSLGGHGCEKPLSPMQDFEYDLTLKHGWLAELAGLKDLRHFGMDTNFWSRMGQAEVEFMDTHWPKLERITFGYNVLELITKKPHWQWLQKKRPQLKYDKSIPQRTLYSASHGI